MITIISEMKENNKGKEILKLLQENYDIQSAQDLSSALKNMLKGSFWRTEPLIVPKNTRDVSGIEDKIISLYG